ncbi:MAG: hypothetical protein ACKV22_39725 [Bryobacteraceae bacterium]
MIEFLETTPFRLVRRLAAVGLDTPSAYLFLCDESAIDGVRADLAAEVQVQLGFTLRMLIGSEMRPAELAEVLAPEPAWPVVLVTLDRRLPKLIEALDLNVVVLTTAGAVLLLADQEIGEWALMSAPNLRNRLTDVLKVGLGEAARGSEH